MDPLTGMLLVGGGLQIYGQIQGNLAEARAQRMNAEFYRFQAEHAAFAGRRAVDLYKTESSRFIGAQVNTLAKAGVDVGSGSALRNIIASRVAQASELNAIERQSDMDVRQSRLAAAQAQRSADRLGSGKFNAIQALGSVLQIGAQAQRSG